MTMPSPQIALRAEPWPPGAHAGRACPICGRWWRPWAGSRLPCHAACLYAADARREIVRRLRVDPRPARDHSDYMGGYPGWQQSWTLIRVYWDRDRPRFTIQPVEIHRDRLDRPFFEYGGRIYR